MSDGITLHCPSCGEYSALKKEYDEWKIKLKNRDYAIPVYTCEKCNKRWAIERVVRNTKKRGKKK